VKFGQASGHHDVCFSSLKNLVRLFNEDSILYEFFMLLCVMSLNFFIDVRVSNKFIIDLNLKQSIVICCCIFEFGWQRQKIYLVKYIRY